MSNNDIDVLNATLIELEQELTSFGDLQARLKQAYDKLSSAEQEWSKMTEEQRESAFKLVEQTKLAIAATQAVAIEAQTMTKALVPLVKAIENVNFPNRLDKIDLTLTTQASTMANFQGATSQGFTDLRLVGETNNETAKAILSEVKQVRSASAKREIAILVLAALALITSGVAVWSIIRPWIDAAR